MRCTLYFIAAVGTRMSIIKDSCEMCNCTLNSRVLRDEQHNGVKNVTVLYSCVLRVEYHNGSV